MKKIVLSLVFSKFSNLMFASFPINNNNDLYIQSNIVSQSSPNINAILGISSILLYILSIIWHLSKPVPKDNEKKKKFLKNRRLIIFTPLVLYLIIFIYSYSTMSISL